MTTNILSQFFDVVFPGVQDPCTNNKESHEIIFGCSFKDKHPTPDQPWPYTSIKNIYRHNPDNVQCEEYFCTSTVKPPEEDGKVRRSYADDTLDTLYVVVLDDMDYRDERLPDPTYVIETSPDNYQIGYVLSEPVTDMGLAKRIVWTIYDKRQNITDPGGKMPGKIVRLPVGWNLKDKPGCPFKVHMVEGEFCPDTKYTWQELLKGLGLELMSEEEVGGTQRGKGKASAGGAGAADSRYKDRVLNRMVEKDLVVNDTGRGWLDVLCPWAENHSKGTGNTAGYSPLGRGALPTQRGFRCLHGHCEGKTGDDYLAHLAEHHRIYGRKHALDELLMQRYCYIESGDLVGDMFADARTDNATLRMGNFRNAYKQRVPLGLDKEGNKRKGAPPVAHNMWETSPYRVQVDSLGYAPCTPNIIFERHGNRRFNKYFAPVHPESTGDPAWFLDHMTHVVPEASERDVVLDWLAFKLQNPGKRSYACIMVSEEFGVGRSAIGDAMQAVLQGGVRVLSLDDLVGNGSQGQYNEWAAENQLIIIDEAREQIVDYKSDTKSYEQLKRIIDNRPLKGERIKGKYEAIRYADVVCNFLIFTNHSDAIRIPEGDRRFFVTRNASQRRETGDYAKLWAAVDNPQDIANLYHWLKAREVKANLVHPPMTGAKKHMTEVNKTWPEQMFAWLLEQLPGELVTQARFLEKADKWVSNNLDPAEMPKGIAMAKKAFLKLRYVLDGREHSYVYDNVNNSRINFRVLRNPDKWNKLRLEESYTSQALEEIKKNAEKNVRKLQPVATEPPK